MRIKNIQTNRKSDDSPLCNLWLADVLPQSQNTIYLLYFRGESTHRSFVKIFIFLKSETLHDKKILANIDLNRK